MCSLEDTMCQNRDFVCVFVFFLIKEGKEGKNDQKKTSGGGKERERQG